MYRRTAYKGPSLMDGPHRRARRRGMRSEGHTATTRLKNTKEVRRIRRPSRFQVRPPGMSAGGFFTASLTNSSGQSHDRPEVLTTENFTARIVRDNRRTVKFGFVKLINETTELKVSAVRKVTLLTRMFLYII